MNKQFKAALLIAAGLLLAGCVEDEVYTNTYTSSSSTHRHHHNAGYTSSGSDEGNHASGGYSTSANHQAAPNGGFQSSSAVTQSVPVHQQMSSYETGANVEEVDSVSDGGFSSAG